MLIDLQAAAVRQSCVKASAVVVGAGIAGTLLASRLAQRGVRVIVLESGNRETMSGALAGLNEVVQVGQPYLGATAGRVRGLGGTSRAWGGAMLPFLPCDMEAHTSGWADAWPISIDELSPYFAPIERMFGLPEGPFEAAPASMRSTLACDDFLLRSAKWPRFGRRNITRVLAAEIEGGGIEIWLNATVDGFRLGESGRLTHVHARSLSGNTLEVEAGYVIIAAGAIEATRLLLLLDARHDNRIFAPDRQLGHYFYDHLSTAAAVVEPVSRERLNRTFGLALGRSGMRDLRIEPSPSLRRQARLPAAFAHVAAITPANSGFAALRSLYREMQGLSAPNWSRAKDIARDLPWVMQAAWWRFARGRLLYPNRARFELMLVLEQMPNPSSTIRLATGDRDALDMPRAVIDWRTSSEDIAAFAGLQKHLLRWWTGSPFSDLAKLSPVEAEIWQGRLQAEADVFHPGGTTRMGRGRSTGVVDGHLQTFAIPNLHVVSTSVFPTGGGANPTFMLMAMALRAADRLVALSKA